MSKQLSREELREQLADIIDEAIDMHSDTALCGERSDYAGNKPYDQTDKILALIAQREQAAELRGKMRGTSFANDAFHDLSAPDLENWLLRERDKYEDELATLQATKPEKETV